MSNKHLKSMDELLAGIPDTGFSKGADSNESAEFVAAHPETWSLLVQTSRGRPKRGQETGSITKSIRFPSEAWIQIEKKAKRLNLSSHAAMRKVLLDWAQASDETPAPMVVVIQGADPGQPWSDSNVITFNPNNLQPEKWSIQ